MMQRAGTLPMLLVVLGVLGAPVAASADPPAAVLQLPQLMAWMHSVRRASATFKEQKFVQMLKSASAVFGPLDLCRTERAAKGDAGTGTIGFDRRRRPSDRAAAGRQGAATLLVGIP